MFNYIKWLFFDVGSTIMNEQIAYEHRMRDIAGLANISFEEAYKIAIEYYKQNKKGDLETAGQLGVALPEWHKEDEFLYDDAMHCFEMLSKKYKIGIIANQALGTEERLRNHGILKYINLVVASAEEGVSKPDKRIFEIALSRAICKPQHAVMVGDRIDNDIIPAKALGMKTIWIKQGFGKYWNILSEREQADYEVNKLSEILEIV